MKKLHKLIIGNYLPPFVLTFFVVLFILLMQFLWKYIDDLMGKGLEWFLIIELLFYASANLVPMALPLAVLLSSIMTFGNLAENSELVALKSAGLSLMKIMQPLIISTLALSLLAFYFTNNLWPLANLKFRSLLYDITEKKPTLNLTPGVFYDGIEGYSIRIEDKDSETNTIYGVIIYDHTDPFKNNPIVMKAKKGRMEKTNDGNYLILTLNDGVRYEEREDRKTNSNNFKPHTLTEFQKQIIRFNLSQFNLERTDEKLFKNNIQMLNIKKLALAEDSLLKVQKERVVEFASYLDGNLHLLSDTNKVNFDTIRYDTAFFESANHTVKERVLERAISMINSATSYNTRTLNELRNRSKFISRHEIEWHRKFTLSYACIILFFIGAPLGAIIKKGGLGMPVVFSVIFFLIFHIISITGEKMARKDVIDPLIGMWMSSMTLTPIGAFFTMKATRDSALFDRDAYLNFFRNLKLFKKK